MPSELETLVAEILEADEKMTKGPLCAVRQHTTHSDGNKSSETCVYRRVGLFANPANCKEHADGEGFALLRNTAPVVAKVIEELVAYVKELAQDGRLIHPDPLYRTDAASVQDAVEMEFALQARDRLAHVNQIIKEAKDA